MDMTARPPGPRHSAPATAPRRADIAPPQLPIRAPRPSASAGTERWKELADDFFRIGHDDYGKSRLHRDNANVGLAAAVLGELILKEYVDVKDGLLWPSSAGKPNDRLAVLVMKQVRSERERPVRDWLKYLGNPDFPGGDVYDHIGMRLQSLGKCHAQHRRFRRSVRYVPEDRNEWAMPWVRISWRINQRERMSLEELIVGNLVLATDLHRVVLTGETRDVENAILDQLSGAPAAIQELVHQTQVACGSEVATVA